MQFLLVLAPPLPGSFAAAVAEVTFRMLSLHDMDRTTQARRQAHLDRIARGLRRIGPVKTLP